VSPDKNLASLPNIAVVIVSYNTAALTVKAVESVLASEGVHCQIYIVDNHSTDRSVSLLRKRFALHEAKRVGAAMRDFALRRGQEELYPGLEKDWKSIEGVYSASHGEHEVTLLLSRDNLGFGRANNVVAASMGADYVLFLNSDAQVSPKSIQKLVHVFEKKNPETAVLARAQKKLDNPGIVAAQLVNPDRSLQRQGGTLPTLSNLIRWMFFLDDLPFFGQLFGSYQHHDEEMRRIQHQGVQKVGWVGGTAMMISQPCLAELGGFDPQIFMYAEDIDLCWRADQKHWDCAIAVVGDVVHQGSASTNKKNAIHGEIKGIVYLWQKYHTRFEQSALRLALRIGLSLRVLIFGILRQYGRQRIYHEALALV
jgi:GT2 family glycosyltransferase